MRNLKNVTTGDYASSYVPVTNGRRIADFQTNNFPVTFKIV